MRTKVYVLANANGKFQIHIEENSKVFADTKEFRTFEEAEWLAKRYCTKFIDSEYISMR